jgi:hypothetical protein
MDSGFEREHPLSGIGFTGVKEDPLISPLQLALKRQALNYRSLRGTLLVANLGPFTSPAALFPIVRSYYNQIGTEVWLADI